jgi:hypothetical protein
MKRKDFDQLLTSIRQAGGIRAGTVEPARVMILEAPRVTRREVLTLNGEVRDAGSRDVRSKRKE